MLRRLQFPNLAVGRTLDFALRHKTPSRDARPAKDEDGNIPTSKEYDEKAKADYLKVCFAATGVFDLAR
jgi:hypothetical protein